MDSALTTSSAKKQIDSLEESEIRVYVQSYLNGDTTAFIKLSPYLEKIIHRVVRSRAPSSSRESLEDIRQECWIESIKNLVRWDPERGSLKNFLFACFSNRALTYIHRNTDRSHTVAIEDVPEGELGESTIANTSGDLNFSMDSRLRDFCADYVLRRVCVAIYIGVFDRFRKRIFNELKDTTGLSAKKLYFLIDYALVTIRKHFVEYGWKIDPSIFP